MENIELRQVELAKLAGCTPKTARAAMRGRLRLALTADGTRIYRNHPLTIAYINEPNPRRNRATRAAAERKAALAATEAEPPAAFDPFALADELATLDESGVAEPGPSNRPKAPAPIDPLPAILEEQRKARIDQALVDLYASTGGKLPRDLEDLRALTLGEIIDGWGTLEALSAAVKATKQFAEMRGRELDTMKRRGDLVDRKIVTNVLAPLIDLAFKRLVGEAPGALRELIVARVLSGGESLALDVEAMIRDEISSILGSARNQVLKELEKLDVTD